MVVRLAILTAAIWVLLFSAGGAQAASTPGCMDCHPVHYAERGSCIDCHRGDPRSTRKVIAHHGLIPARYAYFVFPDNPRVARGKKRIEASACRRCHVIGQRGNRLATDLDQSTHISDPTSLAKAVREPVLYMPDFHFPEPLLTEVIIALFALGADHQPNPEEVPRIVHFEDREVVDENVFVKNCGGCHRTLTEALGGLGSGEVAPNLSGLLTEFFPKTFKEKEPWNRSNLEKWIKNPRESRPMSRMAPIRLSDDDFFRLYEMLKEDISISSQ